MYRYFESEFHCVKNFKNLMKIHVRKAAAVGAEENEFSFISGLTWLRMVLIRRLADSISARFVKRDDFNE
jgi:hypothetical protein